MCKVYNSIGSLATIKSHLHEYNINEYKSVKELISFQKNYSDMRQQIISNHKLLIEHEIDTLNNDIIQLDHSIKTKKEIVEKELLSEIEELKKLLDTVSTVHSNIVKSVINSVKKSSIKRKIQNRKTVFNSTLASALEPLTNKYDATNERHRYIVSSFDDAVLESCSPLLQELDRKKRIIDGINNTIYGALGEQKVVEELEKLSEDYILINDFICNFNPPIFNTQEKDYIKSVQIDHLLVSPSGIFLIETKNWSEQSLNNPNFFSPVQQIKRANLALYNILNGRNSRAKLNLSKHHWGDKKIPIRNLIVFINNKPNEDFKYVKLLILNELRSYIGYFNACFSFEETCTIANYLLNL